MHSIPKVRVRTSHLTPSAFSSTRISPRWRTRGERRPALHGRTTARSPQRNTRASSSTKSRASFGLRAEAAQVGGNLEIDSFPVVCLNGCNVCRRLPFFFFYDLKKTNYRLYYCLERIASCKFLLCQQPMVMCRQKRFFLRRYLGC